jgi:hypothetical protein
MGLLSGSMMRSGGRKRDKRREGRGQAGKMEGKDDFETEGAPAGHRKLCISRCTTLANFAALRYSPARV